MPGPKPNKKLDDKVFALRGKGLTFKQIALLTGKSINNVYRRYKRALKSYTQEGL